MIYTLKNQITYQFTKHEIQHKAPFTVCS